MRPATLATAVFILASQACTKHYRPTIDLSNERSTTVGVQELALVAPHASLMDALQRLRPAMLSLRRGAEPLVSIDEAPPEGMAVLRSVPADIVREVKLVRLSRDLVRQKQWTEFGTDFVILVRTKRSGIDAVERI